MWFPKSRADRFQRGEGTVSGQRPSWNRPTDISGGVWVHRRDGALGRFKPRRISFLWWWMEIARVTRDSKTEWKQIRKPAREREECWRYLVFTSLEREISKTFVFFPRLPLDALLFWLNLNEHLNKPSAEKTLWTFKKKHAVQFWLRELCSRKSQVRLVTHTLKALLFPS